MLKKHSKHSLINIVSNLLCRNFSVHKQKYQQIQKPRQLLNIGKRGNYFISFKNNSSNSGNEIFVHSNPFMPNSFSEISPAI